MSDEHMLREQRKTVLVDDTPVVDGSNFEGQI